MERLFCAIIIGLVAFASQSQNKNNQEIFSIYSLMIENKSDDSIWLWVDMNNINIDTTEEVAITEFFFKRQDSSSLFYRALDINTTFLFDINTFIVRIEANSKFSFVSLNDTALCQIKKHLFYYSELKILKLYPRLKYIVDILFFKGNKLFIV